MNHLPVSLDLRRRPVVVIGGGEVALRKVRRLLDAGAVVTVVSPTLDAGLARLGLHYTHVERRYAPGDLEGAVFAVVAVGDAEVAAAIAAEAEARRVFVNVADDLERSSAILPAVVARGDVTVAVSTSGGSPLLARRIKANIEALLEPRLGVLASWLRALRPRVRARFGRDAVRARRYWSRLLDGPAAQRVLDGRVELAHAIALGELDATEDARRPGRVSLVGAGPGDPDLLTLKAARRLADADVVYHDALVPQDVLARVRADATLVDVGKRAGGHGATQQAIHAELIAAARRGLEVVRLKGGDPFVFGRGGEEIEALREAGVAYEVVPGVTAALGCAAYAGIPLTHRDVARAVRFVTAHCREGLVRAVASRLSAREETLVVYMALGLARELADALIAAGNPADTPVALVAEGTREAQRVVQSTLARLPTLAERHAVRGPALVIVGKVAALAERNAWFGSFVADTPAERAPRERERVPVFAVSAADVHCHAY